MVQNVSASYHGVSATSASLETMEALIPATRSANSKVFRSLAALMIMGIIGATLVPSASQAAPHSKADLVFVINNHIATDNTPIDEEILFAHVPVHTTIVVERRAGASGIEVPIGSFSANGSGINYPLLPSMPIGMYFYMAVAKQDGKIIARSNASKLFDYGDVSLLTLCNAPKVRTSTEVSCIPGKVRVGSKIFNYEISVNENAYQPPKYGTIFDFPLSSCRALTLTYAASGPETSPKETASVRIAQPTLEPQRSSAPDATLRTVTFSLSFIESEPWDLEDNATPSESDSSNYVYYTGSALCWSANGESGGVSPTP
jgi:hypothetical protein